MTTPPAAIRSDPLFCHLKSFAMVKKNPRDTRLTPDEALDRILVRAKSPLAEGEVREIIEKLEGVSSKYLLLICPSIQPACYRRYSRNAESVSI